MLHLVIFKLEDLNSYKDCIADTLSWHPEYLLERLGFYPHFNKYRRSLYQNPAPPIGPSMLRLWLDSGRRDGLHRTKRLFDDDVITDEQYKEKRREILSKHGWSAKQELSLYGRLPPKGQFSYLCDYPSDLK